MGLFGRFKKEAEWRGGGLLLLLCSHIRPYWIPFIKLVFLNLKNVFLSSFSTSGSVTKLEKIRSVVVLGLSVLHVNMLFKKCVRFYFRILTQRETYIYLAFFFLFFCSSVSSSTLSFPLSHIHGAGLQGNTSRGHSILSLGFEDEDTLSLSVSQALTSV